MFRLARGGESGFTLTFSLFFLLLKIPLQEIWQRFHLNACGLFWKMVLGNLFPFPSLIPPHACNHSSDAPTYSTKSWANKQVGKTAENNQEQEKAWAECSPSSVCGADGAVFWSPPLSPPPPSMGEARLARLIFSPENCLSLPPVCPPHPANYPTLAGHSVQLLGPSTRRKQRNVSSHSCPIIAIRG